MRLHLLHNQDTTSLSDPTTTIDNPITKLSWEVDTDYFSPILTVELINTPSDITVEAEVELHANDEKMGEMTYFKTFSKPVRIISNGTTIGTQITDVATGKRVGAIQSVKIEITPAKTTAKIKKLRFNNTDWVENE